MIRYVYTFLLCLAAPFLLFGLYKKKPGKPAFGSRWKEHFGRTPPLKDQSTAPIWIHTVSVGETIAATPFIKQLKEKYPDTPIVITTTTSTGAEQAEKLSDIAEHRYMPLDLPFALKSFLRSIQPKMMLIMETELWPNTIHYVAKSDIPITVINARLSQRSAERYAKFPSIFNLLSNGITRILCQYQADADRFKQLGVSAEKLAVTGSLKFDITIPPATIEAGNQLREQLGTERPVWIAASTHHGEDEQVLAAHQALLKTHPNALLILVPRHPERFNDVYLLSNTLGFNTARRTQPQPDFSQTQVYLGDTMGEMLILMQATDVCFMGGSLLGDKVGGHNVLEPAALGIPCLIGQSYYNFSDITHQLTQVKAAFICQGADDIYHKLIKLIESESIRKQCQEQALAVIKGNQGAVKKTIKSISIT
ncbi:lipid IV(A) 3-deoxy-D-manno-octulosonic acid transferase [Vibrio sp. E150_018]